jgi:hypothetical protein
MSPASASRYRDFAARLLEHEGALVEPLDPKGLEAMLPASVQHTLQAPELVRLGFGVELPPEAQRVSLESDWLDRFGHLLNERGRWLHRVVKVPLPVLAQPERIIEHGLLLQNAIYRLSRVAPAWTRYLMLLLRYTAISDEKRVGMLTFGLNLANGSAVDPLVDDLLSAALSTEDTAGTNVPSGRAPPTRLAHLALTQRGHTGAAGARAGASASLSAGHATAVGSRLRARACLLYGPTSGSVAAAAETAYRLGA